MFFAEHEFHRTKPTKDGATEGDHTESANQILERLGQKKKVIEVAAPQCPRGMIYLWSLFQELSLGLSINGMPPQIVTWQDIKAWREEMNLHLDPWEKLILVRLGYLRASIQS